MKKLYDSWVSSLLYWDREQHLRGELEPLGMTALLKAADKWCWKGALARDHIKLLRARITEMGREVGGSVEFGMFTTRNRRTGKLNYGWPYAAIGLNVRQHRVDARRPEFGSTECDSGYVFVPCALASPWLAATKAAGRRVVSCYAWTGLTPVLQRVEGGRSEKVVVPFDQVAAEPIARPGDTLVLDVHACPRVRSVVDGCLHEFGSACAFGAVEEMIDTVRASLVFSQLPSA
jgi:hypothetical protein